ncbi:MAG TPA: hypothetical protein VK550_35610 [Polyangiaceae bacterium]|nr:hypothetical protein [Polyangiaceae bacterium]
MRTDAATDPAEPPVESGVDATIDAAKIDAPNVEDGEAGSSEDTRYDTVVPDARPVIDVMSEPDACDPSTSKSPIESTCLISERYGIFVSPQGSDTTGAGIRAAPYKTLMKAMQSANGNVMRVYACDEGSGYTDALTIDVTFDGMSLYGGFECTTWTYATTRRARVHPASGVALNVKGLSAGLRIEDFEFDAVDASAGESSIGAIVDTAVNVVLRRVKIFTGKGGAGADGVSGANGADAPSVGVQQQGAFAKCPTQLTEESGGTWGGSSLCGSRGGNGGNSKRGLPGAPGHSGIPTSNITTPNLGTGGAPGENGEDGAKGSDGNAGPPGLTSSEGFFSVSGYTVGQSGGNGLDGYPAQGGGGGGASNASGLCIGASGGPGGMGGCGGALGTGGGSAGASVALLTWMSAMTLDDCELAASAGGSGGKGGNGGKGGAGKPGGVGGAAYTGDAGASADGGAGPGKGGDGGTGGNGGSGGSGAGGSGGPSYTVVYKGAAPSKLNGTLLAHGAGGAKGIGGAVTTVKAPDGAIGVAAEEFIVP